MSDHISREDALSLVKAHNKEPFHIQHALTVEGVMRWFAQELGFGDDADFWGVVGLLHDIDFEEYPEEHCIKKQVLMKISYTVFAVMDTGSQLMWNRSI